MYHANFCNNTMRDRFPVKDRLVEEVTENTRLFNGVLIQKVMRLSVTEDGKRSGQNIKSETNADQEDQYCEKTVSTEYYRVFENDVDLMSFFGMGSLARELYCKINLEVKDV